MRIEDGNSVDASSSKSSLSKQNHKTGKVEPLPVAEAIAFANKNISLSQARIIKNWIEFCFENHRRCHKRDLELLFDDNMEIFLIDVARMSLVQATTSARYLALSYVWGGVAQFTTTKQNLSSLLSESSLLPLRDKIPKVIRDAIALTAALQIQYLWVDSICIIQDDEAFKHSQLSSMGEIYNRATATIIACEGTTADANLSAASWHSSVIGFGRNLYSGKAKASIRRPREMRPILDTIDRSVYNTRGWTFQERLLSRRRIYFVDGQIYFHCRYDMFSADGDLPPDSRPLSDHPAYKTVHQSIVDTVDLNRPPEGDTFLQGHGSEWPMSMHSDDWFVGLRFWSNIIFQMSKKNLTFESDILDACKGIFVAFEGSRNWSFLHGMPLHLLPVSLMWLPVHKLRRRQWKSSSTGTLGQRFPSWSWIGWTGTVCVDNLMPRGDLVELKSRIKNPTILVSGIQAYLNCALPRYDSRGSSRNPEWYSISKELLAVIERANEAGHSILQFKCWSAPASNFVDALFDSMSAPAAPASPAASLPLRFVPHEVVLEDLKDSIDDYDFLQILQGGSKIWEDRLRVNCILVRWTVENGTRYAERIGACLMTEKLWKGSEQSFIQVLLR